MGRVSVSCFSCRIDRPFGSPSQALKTPVLVVWQPALIEHSEHFAKLAVRLECLVIHIYRQANATAFIDKPISISKKLDAERGYDPHIMSLRKA